MVPGKYVVQVGHLMCSAYDDDRTMNHSYKVDSRKPAYQPYRMYLRAMADVEIRCNLLGKLHVTWKVRTPTRPYPGYRYLVGVLGTPPGFSNIALSFFVGFT